MYAEEGMAGRIRIVAGAEGGHLRRCVAAAWESLALSKRMLVSYK